MLAKGITVANGCKDHGFLVDGRFVFSQHYRETRWKATTAVIFVFYELQNWSLKFLADMHGTFVRSY